VTAVIKCMKEQ